MQSLNSSSPCRSPYVLHRGAISLTAGRVNRARQSINRRWGCSDTVTRAAAAVTEKPKASKGPKPGLDKDKRITPKSTDFSRC